MKVVERQLARETRANANVTCLMTVPDIDLLVAVGLIAAVGLVARFVGPDWLVTYLRLKSSVVDPSHRSLARRIYEQNLLIACPMVVACR